MYRRDAVMEGAQTKQNKNTTMSMGCGENSDIRSQAAGRRQPGSSRSRGRAARTCAARAGAARGAGAEQSERGRREKEIPLFGHPTSASCMALVESARLMDVSPVQATDLSIASNTAERRASRAPWRAAPPPLLARVSAANTAAA